jgi:hypothetical protein
MANAAGLAKAAVDGLSREMTFASYHAWEAQALIREALTRDSMTGDPPGLAALQQLFGEIDPGRKSRPLHEANFRASAHLVAFVRAAHAATDLLAPVVYWGLGLDEKFPRPIDEKNVSVGRVHALLIASGIHPKVALAWGRLLDLESYRYLKALVNTIKHRQRVKAGFTVALDCTDCPHGVQRGGVENDG